VEGQERKKLPATRAKAPGSSPRVEFVSVAVSILLVRAKSLRYSLFLSLAGMNKCFESGSEMSECFPESGQRRSLPSFLCHARYPTRSSF
jgi:hypothetical protein